MWILRWATRTVGLLLAGVADPIMTGEESGGLQSGGSEPAVSLALLAALIGTLVLWKWEGIGGGLVLAGTLFFYGINFAASGRLPSGWFLPLYYLPGVFSLTCWWYDKSTKSGIRTVHRATRVRGGHP